MSEAIMWDRMNRAMRHVWHAQRHEDRHSTGIPDVSYSIDGRRGWIELKYLAQMPRVWRLPKWTPEQRNWLRGETKNGGPGSFLMVGVGDDAFMFTPPNADLLDGSDPFRVRALAHAVIRLSGGDEWRGQFVAALTRGGG